MKVLSWIIVIVAWCIPGPLHEWARQLMAERRAGREVMRRYGMLK